MLSKIKLSQNSQMQRGTLALCLVSQYFRICNIWMCYFWINNIWICCVVVYSFWTFISICNVVCHLRKYIIWNSMLLIDWLFPSFQKVPIFSRKVCYLLKRPANMRYLNKLCSCIFILNPLCIGIFEKLYYRVLPLAVKF